MSDLPSVAEVDQLAPVLSHTVPAKYRDMNDHVNVRGHYDLHMEATELGFADLLGLDEAHLARTQHSSFSVVHHVLFHHELQVGDEVSLHLRLLDRGPKTIHAVTILVNRSAQQVASTVEFVEAHVDLTTRRSTPIPDALAARIDAVLDQHRQLTWSTPASRQLGVSRSR